MTHEEVLDEVNVLYERISNSEDFIDGNYTEALEILIDFYETGLIEELEKIKSEILFSELDNIEYIAYWKALKHCYEIVDKHISELKGENNA